MARIIHVDDEQEWIDLVKRALADHRVDSASSYDLALSLIRNSAPYELALIDLNLLGDDSVGGEILDLLQDDFPGTKRVVITAMPPAGDLRAVFDRYGLEDVIIKGKATLPGLRRVVGRALGQSDDSVPRHVKADSSELMERYRDWRDSVEDQIRGHIRDARLREWHGGRADGRPRSGPRSTPRQWQAVQDRLAAACSEFDASVEDLRSADDIADAAKRLDRLMSEIDEAIRQAR